MANIRKESDSLGVVEVLADKLWGAQTQRLLEHFSIGGLRLFAKYVLSKIALREPYPDEEAPAGDAGFFSQVLYVKRSNVSPQTKRTSSSPD